MKPPLQSQIRFMRRFRCFKPGFAVPHAVCHELHNPFTLMPTNAEKSNFVSFSGLSHVLKIAVPTHLTQITKAIVAFVAVYMVDMLRWPFARHVSPRKTMGKLLTVMDGYAPITRRMSGPSHLTDKVWTPFVCSPRERAGVGVIVETRPQMVYSAWRIDCHDNTLTIGVAA